MAFTQANADALRAAIKGGTLRVGYEGNSVVYRDLDEMREILEMIDGEVATAAGTVDTTAKQTRLVGRHGWDSI